MPLRLSTSTTYRSSLNAPPRLSATIEFMIGSKRKQLFVGTARVEPWPRALQSVRPLTPRGSFTS